MATPKVLQETTASLERVANFDPSTLSRTEELGKALSFQSAVEPATKIIELFRRLPTQALDEFPDNHLQTIKAQADQFYNLLASVLAFTPEDQSSPTTVRDQAVTQIGAQYQEVFQTLFPYISFAISRTVDFGRLESQGRAAVQAIEDRTKSLVDGILSSQEQIQKTLEDIRQAAAEQGVSQQAVYFKNAADEHASQSTIWLRWTLISAAVLIGYSVATIFSHNMPGLSPANTYEAIQIGVGKALVFAVGSYLVLTCGRNFLSQKHNEITNRHRQNALQTFRTLVDASASPQAQDIVLTHAAASIFEPQETGYTRQQQGADGSVSAVSMLRSLASPSGSP
ncbi:hypothetical protein [Devosia sp.]|uniref:hypothetical protein n=1 Tax=Devosia sp. TaxID=1871048 RepID=UPI002931E4BA|nr:hypothetical protein [Devosia sp.]